MNDRNFRNDIFQILQCGVWKSAKHIRERLKKRHKTNLENDQAVIEKLRPLVGSGEIKSRAIERSYYTASHLYPSESRFVKIYDIQYRSASPTCTHERCRLARIGHIHDL